MTPSTEAAKEKPSLALAIATAAWCRLRAKSSRYFRSLVGVVTAILTSLFFLRPHSIRVLLSQQRLTEATLVDNHFLVRRGHHNAALIVPVTSPSCWFLFLSYIGVWSAGKTATFAGIGRSSIRCDRRSGRPAHYPNSSADSRGNAETVGA